MSAGPKRTPRTPFIPQQSVDVSVSALALVEKQLTVEFVVHTHRLRSLTELRWKAVCVDSQRPAKPERITPLEYVNAIVLERDEPWPSLEQLIEFERRHINFLASTIAQIKHMHSPAHGSTTQRNGAKSATVNEKPDANQTKPAIRRPQKCVPFR